MQHSSVRVAIQPATEPVTVAECKLDARVDGNDEDALFESWIAVARKRVEDIVRRSLINQTFDAVFGGWPTGNAFVLPYPPLVSVTSIAYYDDDNEAHVLDASSYSVITTVDPGVITLAKNATWPASTLRAFGPVVVRYVAGHGLTPSAVEHEYKAAIRRIVSLLYTYRDAWTPEATAQQSAIEAWVQARYGW